MTTRTRTRNRVVGTETKQREHKRDNVLVSENEEHRNTHHDLRGEPARVRVEGSITQNMGDFNSVRVGVVIERPCENTDEAIEETYNAVSERVDEYLNAELDIATEGAIA